MALTFVAPSSAGAAEPIPDPVVTVTPDGYVSPWGKGKVYARPRQVIRFELAEGMDSHRTVTLENCTGAGCEQRFDNLDEDRTHAVDFFFRNEGDYHFYDRYARAEGRPEMTGVMIVTNSPPPVQPATTTTTTGSPTTTTTRPTTATTGPTTTTTAPTPIRPLEVPDPEPTTTTTAAANLLPAPPPTAPPQNKGDTVKKAKDKPKDKGASTETSNTAPPSPDNAVPPDFIFDPAALTPGPTLTPDASATESGDETAIKASAAASLLDKPEDNDFKLVLMALAGLAGLLLALGGWAWFNRASRYDPA
jgi:hypothetical protein